VLVVHSNLILVPDWSTCRRDQHAIIYFWTEVRSKKVLPSAGFAACLKIPWNFEWRNRGVSLTGISIIFGHLFITATFFVPEKRQDNIFPYKDTPLIRPSRNTAKMLCYMNKPAWYVIPTWYVIRTKLYATHVKTHCLLASCQRLVDNLLQGCWAQQTCYKFVPTTCYRPAIQQFVNKLWVITAL
jgi:hypothetical protein